MPQREVKNKSPEKLMNGYVFILLIALTVLGGMLRYALGADARTAFLGSSAELNYLCLAIYLTVLVVLRKKEVISSYF